MARTGEGGPPPLGRLLGAAVATREGLALLVVLPRPPLGRRRAAVAELEAHLRRRPAVPDDDAGGHDCRDENGIHEGKDEGRVLVEGEPEELARGARRARR